MRICEDRPHQGGRLGLCVLLKLILRGLVLLMAGGRKALVLMGDAFLIKLRKTFTDKRQEINKNFFKVIIKQYIRRKK